MTVYSGIMLICSFIMAIICGKAFIPFLKQLKFGQTVREDGPQSHVVKNGTPTIGGLIFIFPIVIVSMLFLNVSVKALYPIIALVLFAMVGFIDDFVKIKRGKNLGLTAKGKMILLIIVSLVLSIMAFNIYGSEIYIPFVKERFDLGVLYVPFMMIVYIGASNAVNLTDGLDGLASGVTVISLLFIGFISYKFENLGAVSIVNISIGALLGFLMFNMNPARVFMGDTGSLGLGGLLVALTVQTNMQLILLLVGIVYIFETLSVILQVISFKTRGKRIFKMSPVHHHYEIIGFSENQILMMFSVVGIIFGVIAVMVV